MEREIGGVCTCGEDAGLVMTAAWLGISLSAQQPESLHVTRELGQQN